MPKKQSSALRDHAWVVVVVALGIVAMLAFILIDPATLKAALNAYKR